MKILPQKKRVVVKNDILNYSPVPGHKHDIAKTYTPDLQYMRNQLPQKKMVVVANDILDYSPVRGHKHDIAKKYTPDLQYMRNQLP